MKVLKYLRNRIDAHELLHTSELGDTGSTMYSEHINADLCRDTG